MAQSLLRLLVSNVGRGLRRNRLSFHGRDVPYARGRDNDNALWRSRRVHPLPNSLSPQISRYVEATDYRCCPYIRLLQSGGYDGALYAAALFLLFHGRLLQTLRDV